MSHLFIHYGYFYSASSSHYSEALPTTVLMLCRS